MRQLKDLNCFCTISYINVIPAAGLPYYEGLFKDCNDLDSKYFEITKKMLFFLSYLYMK